MIKVIASVVCAFAAMLMIILSLATTYWLQWVIVSHNRNITHYRGLFRHCWESRDNVTDELISAESDCSNDKHTLQDVLKSDWNGAVIALMFLALICHLIAFIIAIVAAIRKGHPFPSFTVGGFFCAAAILVVIALLVFTFFNWKDDVFFSWSYGGGWSTVALSIIAFVLIMADRWGIAEPSWQIKQQVDLKTRLYQLELTCIMVSKSKITRTVSNLSV